MLSVRLDVLDQRLEPYAVLIKHREQVSERMEFVLLDFGSTHRTASTMCLTSSPVSVLCSRRASATLVIAALSRRTRALVSCKSLSENIRRDYKVFAA